MAKVQAIKKEMSAMDKLKSVQSEEPEGKSKVGEYNVPKEITDIATQMWQLKAEKTEIEARIELLRADLFAGVEPIRLAYLKSGYHDSGKVATHKDANDIQHYVVLTWQNKYDKILSKEEPTLRELVGKEYDSLFQLKHSISVKTDIAEDDLNAIIDMVGLDNFKKCFNVSLTIKPTERFTREKHNLFKSDKLQAIGSIVRQTCQFRTK